METISLKSITFNSYENRAKLVGEIQKDSLSYWTTFILDLLDVNKILNLLQKNNEETDINDLIESSEFTEFTEYEIDFNHLRNGMIDREELEFLIDNPAKRQIRA
jgi:hypothetical protein